MLYVASAYGVQHLGITTFVIVADPEGSAFGIYKTLGFKEVVSQVQLWQSPSSVVPSLDR